MVKSIIAAAVLSAFSLSAYAQTKTDQGTSGQNQATPGTSQGQSTTGTSQRKKRMDNAAGQSNDNAGNSADTDGVPIAVEHEFVTVRGIVQSIDRQKRTVTLLGPDGEPVTVKVGNDVANFDKLKVGEPATVKYSEAVAVVISKAGSSAQTSQQSAGGQSDAANNTRGTMTGKVSKVDRNNNKITVKNSAGQSTQMQVSDKNALSGINKGDDIVVKYITASAVTIEPEDTSARRSSGQDGQTGTSR
jgi:Cu/Ag efflux protein CusF